MKFGSFCSGIGAPEAAWSRLGWTPRFFSEIEPFPCAVLAHHYPGVPNLGDMTAVDPAALPDVEILVAGTPCQAFSVAGLRGSLADHRGNLTMAFVELVHGINPTAVVWENVPGVLSTKDNAFGCFLAGLVGSSEPLAPCTDTGSWPDAGLVVGPKRSAAWRILDAQFFGLAQRRRRVFVVSCRTRDGINPGAILFEPEGVPRDSAPSREAGAGVAPSTGASFTPSGYGKYRSGVGTLRRNGGDLGDGSENLILGAVAFGGNNTAGPIDIATACNAHGGPHGRLDFESETFVTHALRAEGFDASEDGTGRGTPLVPMGFSYIDDGRDAVSGRSPTLRVGTSINNGKASGGFGGNGAVAYQCHGSNVGEMGTLRAGNGNETGGVPFVTAEPIPFDTAQITSNVSRTRADPGLPASTLAATSRMHVAQAAVAFTERGREGERSIEWQEDLAYAQQARTGGGATDRFNVSTPTMAVRRLTPRECERLQGFPDDYTAITFRGKPAADGPRYRALGNSMAVPVLEWIGCRIEKVLAVLAAQEVA